jgi:transposase
MDITKSLYYWTGGPSMKESKRGRYFTDEFKRNAVQMVLEKGIPVRKVARDLAIHPNLLHQWRRKFVEGGSDAFVGKGHLSPQDAELKRLQRELEEVKEERDILGKPWPFSPNKADEIPVYGRVPGQVQAQEDE